MRIQPGLTARAWRVLAVNGASHIGTGLTLPFLLLYLHRADGFDLSVTGLILATIGVGGLAATPLAGWMTDKHGAGNTLLYSLLLAGAGTACLAWAASIPAAFGAAAVLGIGMSTMWSAMNSLLAEVVPEAQRVRIFSFNYAAANLGVGLGAIAGGLFLGGRSRGPYQVAFLADAATFVLFLLVLVLARETRLRVVAGVTGDGAPAGPAPRDQAAVGPGWRAALADRRLVAITVLHALLITAVASQLTAAFPAWATGPAKASAGVLGIGFAAYSFVVVAAQPLLIRRIERLRRTRATSAAALLCACFWLVTLQAPLGHGGPATAAILIAALVLAALGEVLLAPALAALVNDIAPDELRGRYNAVFNSAWQIGPVLGPAISGVMIGHGLAVPLLAGLCVVCVLAAGCARGLEGLLPAEANGLRDLVSGVESRPARQP